MVSSVNKGERKRSENMVREMFKQRTLRGMEKPMAVWAMDDLFTENYNKGSSAWRRNMHNGTKKNLFGNDCNSYNWMSRVTEKQFLYEKLY